MRIHDLLDGRLQSAQIQGAGLETATASRHSGFQIEMKDGPQPFKGGLDRLVQRSFGINAVHDVDCAMP